MTWALRDKTCMVGVGTTAYGNFPDANSDGLAAEALRRAADDAGLGLDQIDGIIGSRIYSSTTLVMLSPTVAFGGTVVLMPKFNAVEYLRVEQAEGATHTILVPVQYQRIMAQPTFDDFDLSSFRYKFSTSAPCSAQVKADVLTRWPGGLIEYYGRGTCVLEGHLNPTKLHTVGKPAAGHDIRLIDDIGVDVPAGEISEVVGHSPTMRTGYYGQPEKTRDVEWFDQKSKRFIRTGDIGRFDADGFLTLLDRKKDMIISGGLNIYPSDLEGVLRDHPAVQEVAVLGMASEQWGETPVAFAVLHDGNDTSAESLPKWVNARLGKTQRLAAVKRVDSLPRNAIGKVLKRELREQSR